MADRTTMTWKEVHNKSFYCRFPSHDLLKNVKRPENTLFPAWRHSVVHLSVLAHSDLPMRPDAFSCVWLCMWLYTLAAPNKRMDGRTDDYFWLFFFSALIRQPSHVYPPASRRHGLSSPRSSLHIYGSFCWCWEKKQVSSQSSKMSVNHLFCCACAAK